MYTVVITPQLNGAGDWEEYSQIQEQSVGEVASIRWK